MRIGIDARELSGHTTGVGQYLGGLLDEWSAAAEARRHSYWLYTSGERLPSRQWDLPGGFRVLPGAGGAWWEQVTLASAARRDALDVFFAPGYTAPLLQGSPLVVTVHDVSFAAHPEWFTLREGVRRRWLTALAAARANLVLTDSRFSRDQIVEHLGIEASRIRVIHPGIWRPAAAVTGPRQTGRVLFAGSLFTRRNLPALVRGVAELARHDARAHLDIVGDDRTYPRERFPALVDALDLRGRVTFHAFVDGDELERLYAKAAAFAFLSEYEGFGFTPLEALARGVPPVVLDTPVTREVCGDAAFYAGDTRPETVAGLLKRALYDEEARARVLGRAPEILARYSWRRAAAETLGALENGAC